LIFSLLNELIVSMSHVVAQRFWSLIHLFLVIMSSGLSVPSLGRIQTVTLSDATEASIQEELKAELDNLDNFPPSANPPFLRHTTTLDPHGDKDGAILPPTVGLTAAAMHSMQKVGAAVISPDHNHAVFTIKQLDNFVADYNEENNYKSTTSLYLMPIATISSTLPHYIRLTNALNKVDSDPVWLDNETITFLSNRSGSQQLWTININGGEAEQLTRFPIEIGNVKYNAAKNFITFTAAIDFATSKTLAGISSTELFKKTAELDEKKTISNYKLYDRLYIRRWDHWVDKKRSHLFIQPLAKFQRNGVISYTLQSEAVDLMAGVETDVPVPPFGDASHYDIALDGSEIAYSALLNNSSSIAWSTDVNIYTVAVQLSTTTNQTGSMTVSNTTIQLGLAVKISSSPGYEQNPVYSPDNSSIAYLSMLTPMYESDRSRIMIYNRKTKQTKQIASNWDYSAQCTVWTADSKKIITTVDKNAHNQLFIVEVGGENATPQALVSNSTNLNPVIVRDRIIFQQDSFQRPAELFSIKLNGEGLLPLSQINASKLKPIQFGEAKSLEWTGGNKDKIQGWLLYPVGYSANSSAKFPLAVVIHGGPQGSIGDHWHYRWNPQTLTAHGYAVFCPNFHGSTGFGQKFTDSISGDWGGKPLEDILSGVDYVLRENSWIDSNRVGALGASYGGYMINWINGHSNRFKCLINHDGIFNGVQMYYTTEELFFDEHEHGGTPYERAQLYDKWSPHNYVQNWQTPCLVIHGGADYRVPEGEGIATFTALQRKGIPSKFLYFPLENHWVLNPANSLIWHQNVLNWLNSFLK
jgi:dipeptidyl aminopeptidase/acylaminoacyl peptidase